MRASLSSSTPSRSSRPGEFITGSELEETAGVSFAEPLRDPSRSATKDPLERALQSAVHDVRNRLLVIYSATAWVRDMPRSVTRDLIETSIRLELGVDRVRRLLTALLHPVELDAHGPAMGGSLAVFLVDRIPSVAREFELFFADFDHALARMRAELPGSGPDGVELLFDLEEAARGLRAAHEALLRCAHDGAPLQPPPVETLSMRWLERHVRRELCALTSGLPIHGVVERAPSCPHTVAGDRRRVLQTVNGLLVHGSRHAAQGTLTVTIDILHDALWIHVAHDGRDATVSASCPVHL
jgi:hypothetical protein